MQEKTIKNYQPKKKKITKIMNMIILVFVGPKL